MNDPDMLLDMLTAKARSASAASSVCCTGRACGRVDVVSAAGESGASLMAPGRT